MTSVSVRYIVVDVDAAIAFRCRYLPFEERMHPTPTFAMLTRRDLRLLLSPPGGGPGGPGHAPTKPCRHREERTTSRSRSTT